MTDAKAKLPLVGSWKQMLDHLGDAITPPRDEDDGETKGRPRELKTYMLESDDGFPAQFEAGGVNCDVVGTGVDDIKVLRASGKGAACEFFLDMSDRRFCLLHTNDRSDETQAVIRSLVGDHGHTFDHTWLHSDMLKGLCDIPGNRFEGLGLAYDNRFAKQDDGDDHDRESLRLSTSGSLARTMQAHMGLHPDLVKAMAYSKVRIVRRSPDADVLEQDFAQDDIDNTGYIAVKRGRSVEDHLDLVRMCRGRYSEEVLGIESERVGLKEVGDRTLVEGRPFHFRFGSEVENLEDFVARLFDAREPFRLWGLKSKVRDGYLKVMAVDLHTGSPLDFEITSGMMRVYLFKESCGNTLMRLLTNLQACHDSKTSCMELSRAAR